MRGQNPQTLCLKGINMQSHEMMLWQTNVGCKPINNNHMIQVTIFLFLDNLTLLCYLVFHITAQNTRQYAVMDEALYALEKECLESCFGCNQ